MGETWVQQQNRAKKMEQSHVGMMDAPFECLVQSVSSETDMMTISGPFGTRKFNTLHPYQGNSSWIRSMPDGAQSVLVQFRTDTKVPEIIGYKSPASADRLQRYKATDDKEQGVIGQLGSAAASLLKGALGASTDEPPEPSANKFEAYRPIVPGEHDIGSAGLVQSFFGKRAVFDNRAGTVKQGLNQDRLESYAKSALHRRMFHFHSSNKIQDEERIGAVYRPDAESYIKRKWCKYKGKFARERSFHLLDGERKPLLWEREGHVFDDQGVLETCEDTGKPLRLKNIYYTVGGKLAAALGQREEMTYQLDEEGNIVIDLPEGATTGFIFRTPKGSHQIEIGVDYNIAVDKNWIETIGGDKNSTIDGKKTATVSDSVSHTYEKDWTLKVTEKWDADINGAKILIDGATVHIEDTSGNKIDTGSEGIAAIDKTGNKIEMTSNSVKVTAVTKAVLDAPQIELGDGANNPVVLGNELVDLFNQLIDILKAGTVCMSTSPGAPCAPNPPIVAQLTALATNLLTTASTNILSQQVFAERK